MIHRNTRRGETNSNNLELDFDPLGVFIDDPNLHRRSRIHDDQRPYIRCWCDCCSFDSSSQRSCEPAFADRGGFELRHFSVHFVAAGSHLAGTLATRPHASKRKPLIAALPEFLARRRRRCFRLTKAWSNAWRNSVALYVPQWRVGGVSANCPLTKCVKAKTRTPTLRDRLNRHRRGSYDPCSTHSNDVDCHHSPGWVVVQRTRCPHSHLKSRGNRRLTTRRRDPEPPECGPAKR